MGTLCLKPLRLGAPSPSAIEHPGRALTRKVQVGLSRSRRWLAGWAPWSKSSRQMRRQLAIWLLLRLRSRGAIMRAPNPPTQPDRCLPSVPARDERRLDARGVVVQDATDRIAELAPCRSRVGATK